jgi:hypothetical protein
MINWIKIIDAFIVVVFLVGAGLAGEESKAASLCRPKMFQCEMQLAQNCSACIAKVRECMSSLCQCTPKNDAKCQRDCELACKLNVLGSSGICDGCFK